MPDYSIVNLREVDDDTGGRVDGMRGAFGRKYLDSRDLGVSLWSYRADLRVPFAHSHREQEEAYVVVAGSGRIRLDDEVPNSRSGTSSVSRRTLSAALKPVRTAWS